MIEPFCALHELIAGRSFASTGTIHELAEAVPGRATGAVVESFRCVQSSITHFNAKSHM